MQWLQLSKKIAEDSSESDRGKAVSHKIKTMCTVRLKSNLELQSCSHCINVHFPYKPALTNKTVTTNCTSTRLFLLLYWDLWPFLKQPTWMKKKEALTCLSKYPPKPPQSRPVTAPQLCGTTGKPFYWHLKSFGKKARQKTSNCPNTNLSQIKTELGEKTWQRLQNTRRVQPALKYFKHSSTKFNATEMKIPQFCKHFNHTSTRLPLHSATKFCCLVKEGFPAFWKEIISGPFSIPKCRVLGFSFKILLWSSTL